MTLRPENSGQGRDATRRLAAFLRQRHDAILRAWAEELASIPRSRELSRPALLDHLPHLLDALADSLDRGTPVDEALGTLPDRHALDRLDVGYDLRDVVREYGVLRSTIQRLLEQAEPSRGGELALHHAIDEAVAASVERYTRTRSRTLSAVDRLTTAALESGELQPFLGKLLQVLLETTEAVDSAAILLMEEGELRLRGSAGPSPGHDVAVALGTGFVGRIARDRQAAEITDAASDPPLRELTGRGTRALYGVPMVQEGELAGVVLMGSRSAYRFSDEDRLLLRTVAGRAMALIAQARTLERERAARAELERRTAQLEAVLESLPDAVYVGDAGGIRRMNRVALEQLGFREESELHRPIGELAAQIRTRDPASGVDISEADQPFSRALNGDRVTREVLVAHLETGEERVLRSSAAPVRLDGEVIGAVAVNVDITDQKRLERALRESEARLQSILDHAPAAVYVKDREGRVVLANRALQLALGKPLEAILGRTDAEIVGPEAAGNFAVADAEIWRTGRVVETEEVLPSPEGDRTFISVKFPLPGDDGRPASLCGISMDITERKQAETTTRRVNEVRDLFMGTLGHDLRNPLHAIRASAELLLRGDNLRPGQLRGVARIIGSADRMGRMIGDVMDLARGRLGGTFPIVRQRVNLHEIAGRVVDELHVAHPDRQIHLDLRGDGRMELDPDRTAQVISNLVGNALQHGAAEAPVEVRVCDGDGGAILEVKNRGTPIPEDLLPRIFEPFKGSRDGSKGLGLGLWIVSEIVRAHGGAIAVRSEAAEGTTFTVRLPRS